MDWILGETVAERLFCEKDLFSDNFTDPMYYKCKNDVVFRKCFEWVIYAQCDMSDVEENEATVFLMVA